MSKVKRTSKTKMRREMENVSNRKLNMVIRKIAIDLFGSIVNSTPVDTGRARGSWGIGLNRANPGPRNRKDKNGSKVQGEIGLALRAFKPGDKITISSNLPYIGRLEDGHSKQAPSGMVKRNVSRFDTVLRVAAREVKGRG